MSKDIFDKPFDEGTIAKLEIFENYLDSWLPTLILSKIKKPIQIFDLFAGAGYDKIGVEGSPMRTLRIIRKHAPKLRHTNNKVCLYLNDFDEDKILTLAKECKRKILEYKLEDVIILNVTVYSFIEFLRKNKSKMNYGCNLIFIDQNGFKEVTEKVFNHLINIETSEFIFFISSSVLHRFAQDTEIQKFHPKFDFRIIRTCDRKIIHNVICREFEKYVPQNIKSFSLIPFSIMKSDKNNVYGLIFVSKHIRGADKFLDVVWKKNLINGNANFDIDEDIKK
ncbi:MAG TPA: three-Cys-motif partner protein TcmP, partial [Ignavibacteria bacterium]